VWRKKVAQRFMSPDNVVQAPGNSQSYNRYSYCLNNPLRYTDPSGYTWFSHLGRWLGSDGSGFVTTLTTIGVAFAVAAICVSTGGIGLGLCMPLAGMIGGACGGLAGGVLGTAFAGGSGGDYLRNGLTGAAIGGVCGLMGGSMISSGLSKTLAAVSTSFAGSVMSSLASGSGAAPTISFGIGNINLGNGKIRTIFSHGNSSSDYLNFTLGGLGNASDIANGVDCYTHHDAQLKQQYWDAAKLNKADSKLQSSHNGIFGSNYVGANNASDQYGECFGAPDPAIADYSAVPHDIVWTNVHSEGSPWEFVSNTRALGADWGLAGNFMYEGLVNLTVNPGQALESIGLGIGSTICFSPKSIYSLF